MSFARDRRYGSRRWRALAIYVRRRDGERCWAAGCTRRGNVADHIRRVTPETTDAEFFDERNLRASCVNHNLARGIAGDDASVSGTPPRRSAWAPIVRDFRR